MFVLVVRDGVSLNRECACVCACTCKGVTPVPHFRIFLRCNIYETFYLLGTKCFQYDSKRGKKEISPCPGGCGEWQRSCR